MNTENTPEKRGRGRPKKYSSDEERVAAKREASKRCKENNVYKYEEYNKKWVADNADKVKKYKKKHYEIHKQYYIDNATKWRQANLDKYKELHKPVQKKSDMKRAILQVIEQIGEEEWMKTATEEQVAVWVTYKMKNNGK